jgi:hypothetical protein
LPVIRPEPRNLENLASPLFGECVGDFVLVEIISLRPRRPRIQSARPWTTSFARLSCGICSSVGHLPAEILRHVAAKIPRINVSVDIPVDRPDALTLHCRCTRPKATLRLAIQLLGMFGITLLDSQHALKLEGKVTYCVALRLTAPFSIFKPLLIISSGHAGENEC